MKHYKQQPWLKNLQFNRRLWGRKIRNWRRMSRVIQYNIEIGMQNMFGFTSLTKIKNPRK